MNSHIFRGPLATLLALAAIALAGCGGSGSRPDPTNTAEAPATTVRASTPEPTETGPGRVTTSLSATCDLRQDGSASVTVRYGVHVFGSATLSRVRLMENGKVMEDSGPLSQRAYESIATLPAEPGSRHFYTISIDAPGAQAPRAASVTFCPTAPTRSGTNRV